MLRAKGLLRGDVLEEHQDALHAAGGHLPLPQYPVIHDRKAAFVLVVDHSG